MRLILDATALDSTKAPGRIEIHMSGAVRTPQDFLCRGECVRGGVEPAPRYPVDAVGHHRCPDPWAVWTVSGTLPAVSSPDPQRNTPCSHVHTSAVELDRADKA
jgi:hypothetical protein